MNRKKEEDMKISQLKDGMRNVNVVAKVLIFQSRAKFGQSLETRPSEWPQPRSATKLAQ